MSAAVTHRFADLGDVLIHYVIAGKGPAVVLLHGWPQTWWEWRHVIPALARNYTVIAPDMRGLWAWLLALLSHPALGAPALHPGKGRVGVEERHCVASNGGRDG